MQSEQMTAMWLTRRSRPSFALDHLDDPEVFGQPITNHRIEEQDVAVGSQAAVTQEVIRISQREQRLPGDQWRLVRAPEAGKGLEVQRIAHIFKPVQSIGRQSLGGPQRRLRIIAIHRIHGEVLPPGSRDSTASMRRQSSARTPADLDLHTCVPESEKRPDLVGQSFEVIRLEVVSPARTDGYDRSVTVMPSFSPR